LYRVQKGSRAEEYSAEPEKGGFSIRALPGLPTGLLSILYTLFMADLTLVYGMRLLPAGEVAGVQAAPVALKNGNEAQVTMHILEGSREQIEAQLRLSIDAFFDFYPEI
jgi:hypothetical protein